MVDINIGEPPFPGSPVVPQTIEGGATIQFRCHKGIDCFNACCKNIDISLTPYDVVRMKQRLGMTSTDFLVKYTFPYEMEKDGIAGIKLKPVEGGSACQFMTDEGCSIYEDRPTACRYYPVALLSLRRQDEYTDRTAYAVVKESHCHGHLEPRKLTVDEYRKEQGLEEYDEMGRGWRQLILKKKSSGPTVGKPSQRSRQLFFIASYDVDQFREFIKMPSFDDVYDLSPETKAKLMQDDTELMLFGQQFLRQVMFGEMSIPMKADAFEKRAARRAEREAQLDEIVQKIGPLPTTPPPTDDAD
ncbi:MAG: YkgJ family cysteine cluster protein [Zoogloeaceae bacterium]|nr:YkgJ family cysteine cluster protein [Zoogloeaceae bacterium]